MTAILPTVLAYGIPLAIKGGILVVGWIGGWFHHKAASKVKNSANPKMGTGSVIL